MDWYRHNIGDYDADTLHLSAFEDGVYSRLIRWYYREERPIPDPDQAWATIARIGLSEWLPIAATIRAFFVRTESRVTGVFEWHHRRCNAEIRRLDRTRKGDAKRQAKRRKHNMNSDDPEKSRVSPSAKSKSKKEESQSLSDRPSQTTKTESAEQSAEIAKDAIPPVEPVSQGVNGGAPELPEPAKPARKPKTPKHPMPVDWVPSEEAYTVGREMGLTDDEIGAQAANCRWYWSKGKGAGTARPGWDATFIKQLERNRANILATRGSNGAGQPKGHNGGSAGWSTRYAADVAARENLDHVSERRGPNGFLGMGVDPANPAPRKPGPIPGFGDREDDARSGAIEGDFRVAGETEGADP